MIETKEKEINGSTYSVTQMTAIKALKMQARLLKLLGPAASVIFVAAANDVNAADSAIPNAILQLVNQLDEKTFEALVLDLLVGVRKDGMELNKNLIDMEFSGNLNCLYLVLQFILEVNYADFFQEGGILKAFLTEKEALTPPELKKV